MATEEKDLLSKIVTYLPLLTGLTVSFGILKLITFYSFYNLNILSYLDVTELIFQTLKDFIFIMGSLLFGTFLGMFLGRNRTVDSINVAILTDKVFRTIFLIISLSLIALLAITAFTNIIGEELGIIILFVNVSLTISFFIIMEIGKYNALHNKSTIDMHIIFIIFLSVGLIAFGILNGYRKMSTLKKNNDYLLNTITIEKNVIKSTPTYYYIGKTNNYVFFFNEKNKSTDVYPVGKIDKLTIKE